MSIKIRAKIRVFNQKNEKMKKNEWISNISILKSRENMYFCGRIKQLYIIMALTASNMLPLGTIAPFFSLPDTVSGQTLSLDDVRGKQATVIMFTCNHCPYVIHVNAGIVSLSKDYAPLGVSFVAISSNDVEHYPQDGPDKMKALAAEVGYDFPYLYDASQAVALAYDAACTPDFYVFDSALKLVYRGRIDASRPRTDNPVPVTGVDMRAALDAVLADRPQAEIQYPSMGCNIKWKKS